MPAGIIVFFPSYHFLRAVKAAWLKNGKMEKLRERKEVGESHPLTDVLLYCENFRFILNQKTAKMWRV